jgi:hypothetical protein
VSVAVPSLVGIMGAIADQIESDLGPIFDGLQVEPKLVYNPTPPSIDVYPADPFLEQTSYGTESREPTFTIRARVSTADHEGGQELLLDLLDPRGPGSMLHALEDDPTFGGTIRDSHVREGSPSGFIVYQDAGGGGALLGAEWRLRVIL